MNWLVPTGLLLLAIGLLVWRFRPRPVAPLALLEYWVYLPSEAMPAQDAVMDCMIHSEGSPVGAKEGILFSDIRLHVSLVLRSKNPHVFRPDLLKEGTSLDAEQLRALASSRSLIKLRYASSEPLSDDRHLRFLPFMAWAYAQVGEGSLVFDCGQECLYRPQEFRALLDRNPGRFEAHVQTYWTPDTQGGHARTAGLVKKGIPELISSPAPKDLERVVVNVLADTARQLWEGKPTGVAEAYGDSFEVRLTPKREMQVADIRRIQAR